MAQDMKSDVSDNNSNSPSYDEPLELVHEHQKVIKMQSNEIENLNALNDLNAIFATNYERRATPIQSQRSCSHAI